MAFPRIYNQWNPLSQEKISHEVVEGIVKKFSGRFIDTLFNRLGLFTFDKKVSVFLIPIPTPMPMAIVSGFVDLLAIHNNGLQKMLEESKLID